LADWSLRDDPSYGSDLALRQSRLLVLDTIVAPSPERDPLWPPPFSIWCWIWEAATMHDNRLASETSLTNAVLVNGVKVRCLDLNDVIFIQKEGKLSVGGHPSDNIPVALSTGE